MSQTLENQHLLFRQKEILPYFQEGVLGYKSEAHDVAGPLFDAGVFHAALTERIGYESDLAIRDCHSFTLLLQGTMEIQIEQRHWTIGPGELVYAPPNSQFRRAGPGGTWWIYINIEDIPQWRLLAQRGPFVRVYEHAPLLFFLLRTVLDAHASRGPSAIILARQNCRAIVNLLRHEMASVWSPALRYRSRLQQLIEDIARRPEHNWSVPEMAAALHVSTSLLTKLFRREYNQAPMEMVIHHRVQKASFLLQRTDDTIEAVARAVGYKNPYSFSRLFKQHMGVSPGRYRRNAAAPDEA